MMRWLGLMQEAVRKEGSMVINDESFVRSVQVEVHVGVGVALLEIEAQPGALLPDVGHHHQAVACQRGPLLVTPGGNGFDGLLRVAEGGVDQLDVDAHVLVGVYVGPDREVLHPHAVLEEEEVVVACHHLASDRTQHQVVQTGFVGQHLLQDCVVVGGGVEVDGLVGSGEGTGGVVGFLFEGEALGGDEEVLGVQFVLEGQFEVVEVFDEKFRSDVFEPFEVWVFVVGHGEGRQVATVFLVREEFEFGAVGGGCRSYRVGGVGGIGGIGGIGGVGGIGCPSRFGGIGGVSGHGGGGIRGDDDSNACGGISSRIVGGIGWCIGGGISGGIVGGISGHAIGVVGSANGDVDLGIGVAHHNGRGNHERVEPHFLREGGVGAHVGLAAVRRLEREDKVEAVHELSLGGGGLPILDFGVQPIDGLQDGLEGGVGVVGEGLVAAHQPDGRRHRGQSRRHQTHQKHK